MNHSNAVSKILILLACCFIAACAASTETTINGGGTDESPLITRNVLACTYGGLYNSSDVGQTWARIDSASTSFPYFYDAIYDGQYYYGASYATGLFRF